MTDCAVAGELDCRPTVPAAVSETIFDRASFLARLGGDEQLARELIELFIEEYPVTMATLAEALRNGNAPQLRLSAHSLRGTVANFSAQSAQESAQRLEEMGRNSALSGATEVYDSLVEALVRLRSALLEFSDRLAS